jgi:hypothetical protein
MPTGVEPRNSCTKAKTLIVARHSAYWFEVRDGRLVGCHAKDDFDRWFLME